MIKKIILAALCLLAFVSLVFAQSREDPIYKIYPIIDIESFTTGYIPKNLEDCFKELKSILHPGMIKEMKTGTEHDMIKYHFSLGLWIRNNWGLWKGSRLKTYFNKLGIFHPDDMSGIILDSFWRHLNNKPIKLDEQVKHHQDSWKKQKTVQPKDAGGKK